MEYVIDFILNDSDYGDGNVIISCWTLKYGNLNLNQVIQKAYNYAKSHNYMYFVITDGNIYHRYYDSYIGKSSLRRTFRKTKKK